MRSPARSRGVRGSLHGFNRPTATSPIGASTTGARSRVSFSSARTTPSASPNASSKSGPQLCRSRCDAARSFPKYTGGFFITAVPRSGLVIGHSSAIATKPAFGGLFRAYAKKASCVAAP